MRGFIPSEIQKGDYILGSAAQLKGEILVPDGQWDAYLPDKEDQSREGFEPYACVSYAVSHAVETLINKKYGKGTTLSARFLAYATGTEAKKGNDPAVVCTYLGKHGDVNDADWSYPTPATDFYKTPPQNLYTLALEFPAHYNYDNQWVPATPDTMMDALTRSPLTVAGFAWAQNSDGIYYWPDGAQADHYFEVYGYERNTYWKVFDTYSNEYKKVVWNYPFLQVKEHSLSNQVVVASAWDKFIQFLRQALGLDGLSFGAARSPKWPQIQKDFISKNPVCAVCGKKGNLLNPLNVHHQHPFHLKPELELDENNLITLCRVHHLWWGHLGNWKSFNATVKDDAALWLSKILNRP